MAPACPKVITDKSAAKPDDWRENSFCPVKHLLVCFTVAENNKDEWKQHDGCYETEQAIGNRFNDFCPLRRMRRDLLCLKNIIKNIYLVRRFSLVCF